jgi:hypothetical protein
MEPIINRVAESEIETLDLEKLWDDSRILEFDLAPYLFRGLVLREKDFRIAMAELDLESYRGCHLAVCCSTDAIIPMWAYMLVGSLFDGVAASVTFGTVTDVSSRHYTRILDGVDWEQYRDRPVVVKGCSNDVVPVNAYMDAVTRLKSVARKVMYGEACSAVPIWRRPRNP